MKLKLKRKLTLFLKLFLKLKLKLFLKLKLKLFLKLFLKLKLKLSVPGGGGRVAPKVSGRKIRAEGFAPKVVNPGRLMPGTAAVELPIPSVS